MLPHGFRFPVRVSTYSMNGASQNGLLIFIASISRGGKGRNVLSACVADSKCASPPFPALAAWAKLFVEQTPFPNASVRAKAVFFQQFSLSPLPFLPP